MFPVANILNRFIPTASTVFAFIILCRSWTDPGRETKPGLVFSDDS